jgi:hypothetical protein
MEAAEFDTRKRAEARADVVKNGIAAPIAALRFVTTNGRTRASVGR